MKIGRPRGPPRCYFHSRGLPAPSTQAPLPQLITADPQDPHPRGAGIIVGIPESELLTVVPIEWFMVHIEHVRDLRPNLAEEFNPGTFVARTSAIRSLPLGQNCTPASGMSGEPYFETLRLGGDVPRQAGGIGPRRSPGCCTIRHWASRRIRASPPAREVAHIVTA